jgi:hypothetical protein
MSAEAAETGGGVATSTILSAISARLPREVDSGVEAKTICTRGGGGGEWDHRVADEYAQL